MASKKRALSRMHMDVVKYNLFVLPSPANYIGLTRPLGIKIDGKPEIFNKGKEAMVLTKVRSFITILRN